LPLQGSPLASLDDHGARPETATLIERHDIRGDGFRSPCRVCSARDDGNAEARAVASHDDARPSAAANGPQRLLPSVDVDLTPVDSRHVAVGHDGDRIVGCGPCELANEGRIAG